MSKVICIMGESGSGKTTSLRNLDPKHTYIIDADKKGLSWKGWKTQYNTENTNYMKESNVLVVRSLIANIAEKASHIKTIIVDTINGIMIDDEMRRSKEKGFDKWADMASCIWELVSESHMYRDDLTVIFVAHVQTEKDDSGVTWSRIKTSGKKLDKIVLESKFTTVLFAKCIEGKYKFETQSKNSTAKSPMGAFNEFEIDNDIKVVMDALKEF